MELKQLRHFLAVVHAGSISGAATALGLSQQAVSKSVRSLEASIGVELLDRSGTRLLPNARGLAFAEQAATITAAVQSLEARLREGSGGQKPGLRIGASPTATAPVVTPAVLGLLRDDTDLRVDVANC